MLRREETALKIRSVVNAHRRAPGMTVAPTLQAAVRSGLKRVVIYEGCGQHSPSRNNFVRTAHDAVRG